MTAARLARWIAACALAVPALAGSPDGALGETAWVGGEVRLNVRTGPSTDFRIVESLETGDQVSVLETEGSWTQVQTPAGESGWIPAGYLEPEPPPALKLAKLESEVKTLRQRLDQTRDTAERLKQTNAELTSRDEEQRASLETLRAENVDLKAGARWPYLITGASILGAGIVLGMALGFLARSGRRKARIRL